MTLEQKKDVRMIFVIGAALGLLVQPILANNLSGQLLTPLTRTLAFLFFLFFAPFALWISSLVARVWQGFYQFAKFAAVGVLNSFIDIGIFNLETFLYGSSFVGTLVFAVFKAISFVCATTNSFFWNKHWTFSAKEKTNTKEVASFYTVALIGWVLNVAVATAVKVLGPTGITESAHLWTNLVAPIAGILASFLWDFFGYKFFVFKK